MKHETKTRFLLFILPHHSMGVEIVIDYLLYGCFDSTLEISTSALLAANGGM